MDYFKLSSALRKHKLYLFTLEDIKNLFPVENAKTIKNNLLRWIPKGYFLRLKRDLYEFVEPGGESKIPDLYIANRLYEPSYVSLETALSIYSIIPDIAAAVSSVTTLPTRKFKNRYGSFFYRTCQKKAFKGYMLMSYEGFKVYIADREKALVDFLYYRLRLNGSLDFNQERLNKRILKTMNWKKANYYAKLFNNKTINALKGCRRYAGC
jgi:predicted transcriptional regulator of viral defense system